MVLVVNWTINLRNYVLARVKLNFGRARKREIYIKIANIIPIGGSRYGQRSNELERALSGLSGGANRS